MPPPDYSSLDPCVHCGFCLPACPTYLATGDESDSPRGRIVLMRALERGEIGPGEDDLVQHLDACLGCLGCEPVCPSGVGYGRGIQTAREQLFAARRRPPLAGLVLAVFRREWLWRPLFTAARALRATGIPNLLAGGGRFGFGMGMLGATEGRRDGGTERAERAERAEPADGAVIPRERQRPRDLARRSGTVPAGSLAPLGTTAPLGMTVPLGTTAPLAMPAPYAVRPSDSPPVRPSALLFRGCVMDTLFRHVHDATVRTLEANGYRVVEAPGQVCCGALHEHAGDRASAQALAGRNLAALAGAADYIVVNSAGCGAMLKEYGHLLGTEAAAALAARVRDVSELLAEAGPRPGGPLPLDVAYDAPCHLQHAQRVQDAPLAVLGAIPSLRLRLLPSSDKCCGSAGIYSIVRPAMARAVLDLKLRSFAEADPTPAVVATGNPGCLMQIGAGLRAAGLPIRVAHPVELLDESYRRGGVYEAGSGER